MLLADKHALVFAAIGAIGGAVARTFAKEGAHVWLSGRDAAALDALAAAIRAEGGTVAADVSAYVDWVAATAGRIDSVFNAIGGRPADLGYPAASETQPFDLFLKPLRVILGSTFLTSRAEAARMAEQGHGAVVTLSASLADGRFAAMAGISATQGGIEAMTRSLAGEFGPAGVRINCLRATAMPETRTIRETAAGLAHLGNAMGGPPAGSEVDVRPLSVAETAAAAAFLASDAASGMTAQVVNVYGRIAA